MQKKNSLRYYITVAEIVTNLKEEEGNSIKRPFGEERGMYVMA